MECNMMLYDVICICYYMCGYTYVLPDNVHSNLTSTSPWPFVQIPCWNPWAFAQIQCKPPRHLGEKKWARSVWNPCIFEVPKWSKWGESAMEICMFHDVSWCFMTFPLLKFHSHRQPWMKLWKLETNSVSRNIIHKNTWKCIVSTASLDCQGLTHFWMMSWLNLSKP